MTSGGSDRHAKPQAAESSFSARTSLFLCIIYPFSTRILMKYFQQGWKVCVIY